MKFKSTKLKNLIKVLTESSLIILLIFCCLSYTSAQSWVQLNDSPFIDDHTNGFGFEDRAYVFRGIPRNNGNGDANELWEYTPETDSWERIGEFPGPARRISIGDDWNGKYYYGFGIGGPNGLLNDLWEFDPVDQSFTQLPSCPCVGRSHPSLIAHNDKIFMGAGSSFGGDLKDWWEYDMITQEWTQKEDIPGTVRHHMFHFSSGDYVYVGGGHVSNWNRWDPANDEWTPIDDLPKGRVAGTQFNYAGLGFLLAGDDRFHVHVPNFETFMFFDPEIGEWDYLPPLPNGSRWAPSSFIVNDELFFLAGDSDLINGDATMWKFDLSILGCTPPNGLNAVDVDDVSAGLLWSSNANSISDTLLWRKVGDIEWNRVVDAQAVHEIDGLEACTEYEFQVIKTCDDESAKSDNFTFKTDGCCVNPVVSVNSVDANSAMIEWDDVLAAEDYNIRWKPVDELEWTTVEVTSGPYELTELNECTEYEFQIESICATDEIGYSESVQFLTRNCGACIDIEYCKVSDAFAAQFIFINKVGINDYVNESGNNEGYANFDGALAEDIELGKTFNFVFEPGFVDADFPFGLNVWIDLNLNGSFDQDEVVLSLPSVGEEISREILIPESSTPGLSRMRIHYSDETDPCVQDDNFLFGEVEDYCINIVDKSTSTTELKVVNDAVNVYPNPFQNTFILSGDSNSQSTYKVSIMNLVGQQVRAIDNYRLGDKIVLADKMNSGVYLLVAENETERLEFRVVKQD